MNEPEQQDLVFYRSGGGRVKVPAAVLSVMQSYAQHDPVATEAGGVMMGRYIASSNDVVIDVVTEPMPGDRRTRYSFYRDKRRHQAAMDAAWEASGHTCTYLGEWHTHPEERPTPSEIDIKGWNRRLCQDQFDEELFFLIIGTHEPRMWAAKSATTTWEPLKIKK
ncbi:Mov34/MPN/PAD-1 family protein [Hymenobacter sp. BT635]|uniref:Mov34/MPN/PAD-1 family protein n=1 Tax=Hymenobacter nitidus TaxID=2880929 RepID=A0ABS8AIZ5_9BACT|nr:Mov34/MPN/PAD-1 family protein [Hymenobacter nitidus]MCB2380327.1 Mov34/MPN/PAD-1 family protein [Hymenobacter nitidus]